MRMRTCALQLAKLGLNLTGDHVGVGLNLSGPGGFRRCPWQRHHPLRQVLHRTECAKSPLAETLPCEEFKLYGQVAKKRDEH